MWSLSRLLDGAQTHKWSYAEVGGTRGESNAVEASTAVGLPSVHGQTSQAVGPTCTQEIPTVLTILPAVVARQHRAVFIAREKVATAALHGAGAD